MKDILIVVSPSKDDNHPVYREIETEVQQYEEEGQQILYTTFLLKGPKSFERAVTLTRIADRHGFDIAVFEIESILKCPKTRKGEQSPIR
jgi:hypothetical protein